ncbi:hypothetical protein LTR84_005194 [Exophiala bonariae]|uniref:Uncharacterized protein n=1 Tax=Exophiala bonariae TaxID=1690606 RepID=A0AAV9NQ06_9EURO|nr:hypothetical protein LTR84_005194 [Exophiala bonariae]
MRDSSASPSSMEDRMANDDKTTDDLSTEELVEGAVRALSLGIERGGLECDVLGAATPMVEPAREPLLPIDCLSASHLHGLVNSKNLTLLFIDDSSAEPWTVTENLPWNIAATFSSVWRDELGGLKERHFSDATISPEMKPSLVIRGGHFGTYQEIITWMLLSCRGYGIAPWPDPIVGRFTNAYLTRLCAHHIRCDYLVEAASNRMEQISNRQIHSEDCRALWMMTPADEEMKQFLVEHVATRLWKKRLRARAAYWTLRNELPDLDQAIRTALGVKTAAHQEWKEAGENDAKGRLNFNGSRRQYARDAHQVYEAQQQQHSETKASEEPKDNTIMLQAEVIRKAARGRPAYAKLDLACIGMTNAQFLSSE